LVSLEIAEARNILAGKLKFLTLRKASPIETMSDRTW
jgi:hypothetical protein